MNGRRHGMTRRALLLLVAVYMVSLWCGYGVVSAAAAPKPSATAVAPTPPAPGTIQLADDHIPNGTTSVQAHLEGFHPGDQVTITGESAASGGPLTFNPGGTTIGSDGAAAVSLAIPAIAPDGTYTVRAAGSPSDIHAQAFLTIQAPVGTPPPSGPRGAPTLTLPSSLNLGTGATTPVTLAVANFAPDTTITVSLTLLSVGAGVTRTGVMSAGVPVEVGVIGPTNGDGTATGRVDVPGDLPPGTYEVVAAEATGGIATAQTSVTIYSAAESGNPAALFCGVANICTNMEDFWGKLSNGALLWAYHESDNGRDDALTTIMNVALTLPDMAASGFLVKLAPLIDPFEKLFLFIFKMTLYVRIGVLAWDALRGRQMRGVLYVMGIVVFTLWAAKWLYFFESAVWQWVQRWIKAIDVQALKPLTRTLKAWMSVPPHDLLSGGTFSVTTFLALCTVYVFIFMLLLIVLLRLGAIGLQFLLTITGLLFVALGMLPSTRGSALWWLRSQVMVTIQPVLYALLIQGGILLVFSLDTLDPVIFGNPFVRLTMISMVIAGLVGVPRISAWMTTQLIRGGGGVASDVVHAAPTTTIARNVYGRGKQVARQVVPRPLQAWVF